MDSNWGTVPPIFSTTQMKERALDSSDRPHAKTHRNTACLVASKGQTLAQIRSALQQFFFPKIPRRICLALRPLKTWWVGTRQSDGRCGLWHVGSANAAVTIPVIMAEVITFLKLRAYEIVSTPLGNGLWNWGFTGFTICPFGMPSPPMNFLVLQGRVGFPTAMSSTHGESY